MPPEALANLIPMLTAYLCMAGWGAIVLGLAAWWLRMGAAPVWLGVLWGMFGAAPLAYYLIRNELLWPGAEGRLLSIAVALLVAPWAEEGVKILFFLLRGRGAPLGFMEERRQRLVAGAAIGIGFAITEAIFHLWNFQGAGSGQPWNQSWERVVLLRTVGTMGMHAAAAGLAGYIGPKGWMWIPALLAASAVHFAYNAAALSGSDPLIIAIGVGCWFGLVAVVLSSRDAVGEG